MIKTLHTWYKGNVRQVNEDVLSDDLKADCSDNMDGGSEPVPQVDSVCGIYSTPSPASF